MHSNISITDGVYGILSDNDVRGQIIELGKKDSLSTAIDLESLLQQVKQLIEENLG